MYFFKVHFFLPQSIFAPIEHMCPRASQSQPFFPSINNIYCWLYKQEPRPKHLTLIFPPEK